MPSVHWLEQVFAPTGPWHIRPAPHAIAPLVTSGPSQLPPAAIDPDRLRLNAPAVVDELYASTARTYAPAGRLLRWICEAVPTPPSSSHWMLGSAHVAPSSDSSVSNDEP